MAQPTPRQPTSTKAPQATSVLPLEHAGSDPVMSPKRPTNKSLQKVVDTLWRYVQGESLIWHNPCLIHAQLNLATGNAYTGINQLITALVADAEGYQSTQWATYRQIANLGGKLVEAKGKGVPIIFYKKFDEDEDKKSRFVIRHSCVFNLDLVEGVQVGSTSVEQDDPVQLVQSAEAIASSYIAREALQVQHGRPAYVPSLDLVKMPAPEELASTDEFYSTYFHELAHSVGHPSRLARFGSDAGHFESREDYSREELVAEITSALLCHDCGVDSQASIKNSGAYLQGWSRFIRDNEDAFLTAVSQAYKTRQYIRGD